MMAIDLLYDDAAVARGIIETSKPNMSKEEYLAQQKSIFNRELFDGAGGEVN
jgi:hypothetical protein